MEFPVSLCSVLSYEMTHSIGIPIFRLPLRAEGHEVLYLAKASVIQIIFGAKGSVWIVYEHADEMGDHCRRILNFPTLYSNMPRLIQ